MVLTKSGRFFRFKAAVVGRILDTSRYTQYSVQYNKSLGDFVQYILVKYGT